MDELSRFTVTESPLLQPGCDFITGGINGPFIDTGRRLRTQEFRAGKHVYISFDVVAEMARVAGLIKEPKRLTGDKRYEQGVADGYAEAMREVNSDLFRDMAEHLGYIVDRLHPLVAALESSAGNAPEQRRGTAPHAQKPSGAPRGRPRKNAAAGQDDRDTGDEGPAGVSTDTGDGLSLRL